jgi:hypothetical protein
MRSAKRLPNARNGAIAIAAAAEPGAAAAATAAGADGLRVVQGGAATPAMKDVAAAADRAMISRDGRSLRLDDLLAVDHASPDTHDIVAQLNLLRPIYSKTTNYGHFGKDDKDLTWETTDKAAALKKLAK